MSNESVQLISNHTENHKDRILKLFETADEIIIAVAFLKFSGLKVILNSINKKLKKGG